MSRIFQITGYPRSGTAWLTTMFNLAPEVMAYHELAMTDPDWKRTIQERSTTGQIVFDIGTYQYFPKAVIGHSRKFFILKDPEESQDRVSKATGLSCVPDAHLKWKRMADNWCSEWQPVVIDGYALFTIPVLEQLWKRCFGDRQIRFPTQKVEQLLKFNIQLHEPAKALADPGAITRLAELL